MSEETLSSFVTREVHTMSEKINEIGKIVVRLDERDANHSNKIDQLLRDTKDLNGKLDRHKESTANTIAEHKKENDSRYNNILLKISAAVTTILTIGGGIILLIAKKLFVGAI